MVQQEKDNLLHKNTHHTNLMMPHSEYVRFEKFPEQCPDMIGKIIDIKYRNMYINEPPTISIDEPFDPHDIFECKSKVLRCDKDEPFRMISISEDYKYIFIQDSRFKNDTKLQVPQYPIQFTQFIGLKCHDQFPASINELNSIILRCDNGEPCYAVIVEYLNNGTIRIVLGDEIFTKIDPGQNINNEKTEEEIILIRRNALEGRQIYIGNQNS